MQIDALLARPGLQKCQRTLVGAAVAIWRGQWSLLREWIQAARTAEQARADLEETLLQAVLFCGFPRVVTAFEHLGEVWPAAVAPAGGALPLDQQAAAGRALFAAIYERNTAAVDGMLRSFHADFHAFVLDVAYGRILTRPQLEAKQRELLAVALLAAQNQPRQFAGHARGAVHCGADAVELREVLVTVFGDGPELTDWLRRLH